MSQQPAKIKAFYKFSEVLPWDGREHFSNLPFVVHSETERREVVFEVEVTPREMPIFAEAFASQMNGWKLVYAKEAPAEEPAKVAQLGNQDSGGRGRK